MKSPAVAVIILIWNGRDDTVECLESLRLDQYSNKRVIVVDNGSSDDSLKVIKSNFPEVAVIETGENLGFTGGNNVGIRRAIADGADYVYVLNNDTTVEPDSLSALVDAAERMPTVGLLAPVMHYFEPPRDIWFAGSQIALSKGLAFHDNSRNPNRNDSPYEVPWVSGCAMLMPCKLADDLGGFDDRYFLTSEDVDLSLRVRQAGYSVVTVPAARIYHKGGKSGKRISGIGYYYVVRNKLLLVKSHCGSSYLFAALRIIGFHFWDVVRQRQGSKVRMRYFRSMLDAVYDHAFHRYGPYRSTAVKITI